MHFPSSVNALSCLKCAPAPVPELTMLPQIPRWLRREITLHIGGISFSAAFAAHPETLQHAATFIAGDKSPVVRSVACHISDKQSFSVAAVVFNFR